MAQKNLLKLLAQIKKLPWVWDILRIIPITLAIILIIRSYLLPMTTPPVEPFKVVISNVSPPTQPQPPSLAQFDEISRRNIFNSRGLLPVRKSKQQIDEELNEKLPPQRTTLPLALVGTITLYDELKSIATIEDKSQRMVLPVKVNEVFNDIVEVRKIEKKKVTFKNLRTKRLEFVDIPDDDIPFDAGPTRFPMPKATTSGVLGAGIQLGSDGTIILSRDLITKATTNLQMLLNEAKADPAYGNGGVLIGWRLTQITPGSLYEQLKINNGDVITSVGGKNISDINTALTEFNKLKTASKVDIALMRDGAPVTQKYVIK